MPEQRFRSGDIVECVEPIDSLVRGEIYEVWRSRMEPIGGEMLYVLYPGTKRRPNGAARFRLVGLSFSQGDLMISAPQFSRLTEAPREFREMPFSRDSRPLAVLIKRKLVEIKDVVVEGRGLSIL